MNVCERAYALTTLYQSPKIDLPWSPYVSLFDRLAHEPIVPPPNASAALLKAYHDCGNPPIAPIAPVAPALHSSGFNEPDSDDKREGQKRSKKSKKRNNNSENEGGADQNGPMAKRSRMDDPLNAIQSLLDKDEQRLRSLIVQHEHAYADLQTQEHMQAQRAALLKEQENRMARLEQATHEQMEGIRQTSLRIAAQTQERAKRLAETMKQSEFVLDLTSLENRFLRAANREEHQATHEWMRPAHTDVLELLCAACQNHLRNFMDRLIAAKAQRREDQRKESARAQNIIIEMPSILKTVASLERDKLRRFTRISISKAAERKGIAMELVERELSEREAKEDEDREKIEAQQALGSSLRTRQGDAQLITVLDFVFVLNSEPIIRDTARVATVIARINQRQRLWPASFQRVTPI